MEAEQRRHQYVARLEGVIRQMLTPLKVVPFNLVVEAMTGCRILEFEKGNRQHRRILDVLITAARVAANTMNRTANDSRLVNAVGNKIGPYIKDAINALPQATATTLATQSVKHKSAGYPDIEVVVNGVTSYVECQTFNANNVDTTQRSFSFSPSDEFKVSQDALHFVLSYEIPTEGAKFRPAGFRLFALEALSVDVKHECNSDNRCFYSGKYGTRLLHEERCLK